MVREHVGMITFAEFESQSPLLAGRIRDRLQTTGLGLLGTLRADGSPRISPIEVSFQDGRLYVGMMPDSCKARDVRRDPRCALLTPVADKDDLSGEGKLFAVAVEVTDRAEAAARLAAAVDATDVDPEAFGDSPMFELCVTGAAWQHVEGDAFKTSSWNEADGARERERVGPAGSVVEVV